MDMKNFGNNTMTDKMGTMNGLSGMGEDIGKAAQKTMEEVKKGSMTPMIEDIMILTGKNAGAPSGYEKIDVDLNKGAGGAYLYLCYKYGNDPEKAINGIDVIIGNNASAAAPVGFTRVEPDLNKGAGGKYIYLCVRKGPDKPIKEITVIHGKSSNIPVPEGFTKIDRDLNKGAGGEYIYVCYKK